MIQTEIYDTSNAPAPHIKDRVVAFLFEHLEQYGDSQQDITKAYNFAMQKNIGGGYIIASYYDKNIVGAAIINKTGMEGYIPENILVYIATHKDHRGKGIAAGVMEATLTACDGNIALHVEPDNPALKLYEKFGFTNKYLEMRLNRKEIA